MTKIHRKVACDNEALELVPDSEGDSGIYDENAENLLNDAILSCANEVEQVNGNRFERNSRKGMN